jgi:tripartite-type tricarboxylate transporter receptor subunit TctC
MSDISVTRRTILATGLAGLASALLPIRSALAAYPEQTIKWIVAYAAGGGTDTLARILAETMSPKLGQAIVIENRPGGATNIGATAAAKADPDGHTLFTADNGTLVFNPALFRKLPYDAGRDFRPVGLMARFPLVVAVKKDSVSTSVRDLVDGAKAQPGAIDYASPGVGSPHHLTMERLSREAGVRFNHVPYRGAAPALNDLVGGHVESMVVDYPSGLGFLREGNIRPLAVCSAARLDGLPEVPTVQEALGLQGFEAYAWQGLVVPKATPDAIVDQLSGELAAALRDEPVLERLRSVGLEPLTGGPADMQRLIEAERAVWVPLISSLGITLD